MANPSNVTSVNVGSFTFNALSTQVGIATHNDDRGIPLMGTLRFSADITVDIHDTVAMPFATLNGLFSLANTVTREKVVPIKITYWRDELKEDAICTYIFDGWISHFMTTSGGGGNHELHLQLQPQLDAKQFINLTMGN